MMVILLAEKGSCFKMHRCAWFHPRARLIGGAHCRCGPCKVMLPLLVKLQEEQPDIKVYKLNCNKKNKELGMKLNVKVAPTFQLYKNSNKVCASPHPVVLCFVNVVYLYFAGAVGLH